MTDTAAPIGAYCERLTLDLAAEPLNVATNAAFLLAAIAVLLGGRGRAIDRRVLGGLILAVGVGSTLFHALPTPLTAMADVGPILAFILAALWLALVRLVGFGRSAATVGTAVFLALAPAVAWATSGLLGSSSGYLPALLAIVAIAVVQGARRGTGAAALGVAGLVFAVSIAARMADRPLCDAWPTGTHFVWHILNGVVLYLVARAILAAGPAATPTARAAGR